MHTYGSLTIENLTIEHLVIKNLTISDLKDWGIKVGGGGGEKSPLNFVHSPPKTPPMNPTTRGAVGKKTPQRKPPKCPKAKNHPKTPQNKKGGEPNPQFLLP
uniref:hypothetical protein n=1 Tax=Helicobacter bizzozeronii TaxID=56877 RepID=UPI001F40B467